MKEEILEALNDVSSFNNEEKTQAIMRCVDVIEHLYETASRFAVLFIETQSCEKAKELSDHPEELAIKVMEAAMRKVAYGIRPPGEQLH